MDNEYIEISEKTLDDCITVACRKLMITSDKLEYEVIDQGSSGFMGFNARNAVIRAKVRSSEKSSEIYAGDVLTKSEEKNSEWETYDFTSSEENDEQEEQEEQVEEVKTEKNKEEQTIHYSQEQIDNLIKKAEDFLGAMFDAMDMDVSIHSDFDSEENVLNINFEGEEMGVLIGKRGQTLDSIQYLVSLIVNKQLNGYVHVKTDTENYRARRKKTLENLARNVASKVKRTHRAQTLEPMNPYERRIIHSALQSDRYVTTYSEGEDPYRRVVITPKK